MFLTRASYKCEEFRIILENDWHKKIHNYPTTANVVHNLFETYQGSDKFISSITLLKIENCKRTNAQLTANTGPRTNLQTNSNTRTIATIIDTTMMINMYQRRIEIGGM